MTGLRFVAGALALGLVGASGQVDASTLNLGGAPRVVGDELLLRVAVQPYSLTYSVRNIQILLNELGYNAGTPDGAAGAKTKAAIAAFQADRGFPVNGQPSKVVFIQLQQAVAAVQGSGGAQQYSGQQTTSSSSYQSQGSSQQQGGYQGQGGASSNDILQAQAALRKLGYPVSLTGQMDNATTTAIRDYQVDNGMPITGQVDGMLLASLSGGGYSQGDMGGYPQDDMGGQDMGSMSGQGMGGGATSDEVYEIEQYLEALGYATGTADGVVDAQTRQAIKEFQADMDLPVDGQPSAQLLLELQTAYSEALAEAEGGGMNEGGMDQGGMDQGGMMGADQATIQQIEQALKKKGYAVGPVDGVIDMQSQRAIDDFIRHAQLTIPNQPSAELLMAIQSSSMTAKQGMKNDLIKSGVDALTNILTQ